MCSTPKPTKKIKGKVSNNVVSILSQVNAKKRKQFAERANEASERREIIKKTTILKQNKIERAKDQASLKKNIMMSKPWHYWLIRASFSEIFHTIFHKKPSMK